ncbi:MAG: RnfABCDGE type electron transport complex subunit B [Clostridia bacterium]|nr:RnfABCDGE type electron transport complex subunit B [Clostridia bacterium]
MTAILLPVAIVGVIGLIGGVALAVASKIMAVETDETAEAINEILPGANCGSCGFSGCAGYAAALSEGKTKDTALCNPGGNEVSKQIAQLLGLEAGNVIPTAAVVMCQGNCANAKQKMHYDGVYSCRMATQLFGGEKECVYGCLGLGDCERACPYGAIHICDGVARINPAVYRGCKVCVAACPKHIIEMVPLERVTAAVLCKNTAKGAQTRKACSAGCIGCQKCKKVCPNDAITVENNLAHVDYDKCGACGECAAACPTGAIEIITVQAGVIKLPHKNTEQEA